MKIIEAMKKIKLNEEKLNDLRAKISNNCANLSHETPVYEDVTDVIAGWLQSCEDIAQENVRLLVAIQRTNLATFVSIELPNGSVDKCVAEWVWRRRKYADLDFRAWNQLNDRGLTEGRMQSTVGEPIDVTVNRHFNPEHRDMKMDLYRSEPHLIDAALEIVNATVDLAE